MTIIDIAVFMPGFVAIAWIMADYFLGGLAEYNRTGGI